MRAIGCVGILVLAIGSTGCAGGVPDGLGVREGHLAPCPSSPNCVSSDASDPDHGIDALAVEGAFEAAWQGLRSLLEETPRVRIVTDDADYLHAVYTTRIMRYRDDVEFHARRDRNEITVRSASRVGYSDMGANRSRVERIRAELARRGLIRAAKE